MTIRVKPSQFSIRAEADLLARAERLLEPPQLSRLPPSMQRLMVSRAAVLRECMMRGLEAYEADLGLGPIAPPAAEQFSKPAKKARR